MKKLMVFLVLTIIFFSTKVTFTDESSTIDPYLEDLKENSQELISARTEFSKTFLNVDGTFTSVLSMEPMHFLNTEDKWDDIDLSPKLLKASTTISDSTGPAFYKNPYYDGSSYANYDPGNCLGNSGSYTYRQTLRWDFGGIGSLSNFNVISAFELIHANNINPDVGISMDYYEKQTDPDYWETPYAWYNYDWGTYIGYVTLSTENIHYEATLDADDVESKIVSNDWYGIGHRIDVSSKNANICHWKFYITYSYGGEKAAHSKNVNIAIKPNPFNPQTSLTYTIGYPSHVLLEVYSITGQKVSTLVNGHMSVGTHTALFNGSHLSTGIYFYRFTTTDYTKTGKMLLVK